MTRERKLELLKERIYILNFEIEAACNSFPRLQPEFAMLRELKYFLDKELKELLKIEEEEGKS